MKKFSSILLVMLGAMLLTTSCNDYLDTLPDDRAEANTPDKVKSLLVSAYSSQEPQLMMELSTDNVMDNGKTYTTLPGYERMYRFQQVTETMNDAPYYVWQNSYRAVGTANEALDALAKMENNATNNAYKAEALLARAYNIFALSNAFCMAYDPAKADQYLGLPYPKEANKSVNERGSLKELYENINADIEAALPLLNDTYLDQPKYHMNRSAAYALAARFNLYYHNYDKAIEYATAALGSDPTGKLRDMSTYTTYSADDFGNAYVKSNEKANLFLQTVYSLFGRIYNYPRFNFGRPIVVNETFWAAAPWNLGGKTGSGQNLLYEAHRLFGNDRTIREPKMEEFFEVTDKVNQTGRVHVVLTPFTGDETLLVRAEAYIMKKDYTHALQDMNAWMGAHVAPSLAVFGSSTKGTRPVLTEQVINDFYNALDTVPAEPKSDAQRGNKKPLHPQGFTVEEGTQTNMLYMLLQMRRVETWKTGLRFMDIKRYGIQFSHPIDGEETLVFKAGDLRGALQLPEEVITAGLEKNPR